MAREKSQPNDDRLATEEHRQATRMDGMMDSLLSSLQTGAPITATSSAKKTVMGGSSVTEPEPEHLDVSDLAQSLSGVGQGTRASGDKLYVDNPYKTASNQSSGNVEAQSSNVADYGDLNGLIYGILAFPFSSDESARAKEISKIQASIAKEQSMVKVNRIVSNTKKIVQGSKEFFVSNDGSVRMEFSILGHKYSMKVQGSFLGNECLYPTVEGDSVVGLVMRHEQGDLVNASKDFKVIISEGWKES